MAGTSILKEFLVRIGFQIDPHEVSRVTDTLDDVESGAKDAAVGLELMGAEAAAVITAIIAGMTAAAKATMDAASDMDKLNFAAQRTGDSARNLTTFGYAMSQIGVDANQAVSAVEHMSSILRQSPGLNAFLGRIGVDTNAAPTEKMIELVGKLRQMPQYLAAQYGKMFGLDEQTLYLMEQNYGKLQGFSKEGGDLLTKDQRDVNKEVLDANATMTQKRELGFREEDLKYKAADAAFPLANLAMRGMNATVDGLVLAGSLAGKALDKMSDAAGKVTTEFKSWIAQFEGYSPRTYNDVGGKPTVGFGHLLRPGERAPSNRAQAGALRDSDMSFATNELAKAIKVSLTEGQKSALKDFIYNVGAGNFEKFVAPVVNSGDNAAVAAKLMQFDKYHNKQGQLVHSDALQRRREREASEFSPTINQKTDINISGAQDPRTVAQIVNQQQRKTNSDIVRQMRGVMQ
jgi:GH24 family phage-related lysozyme (muramidase)